MKLASVNVFDDAGISLAGVKKIGHVGLDFSLMVRERKRAISHSVCVAFCCAVLVLGVSANSPGDAEPASDPFISIQNYKRGQTDQCTSAVNNGLQSIPKDIKSALLDAGYTVLISPTMLSAVPGQEGGTPRGWREDSTYDNVGGLFHPATLQIVIPETIQSQQRPYRYKPNTRIESTVRHEVGHAYDHYQGNVSHTDDFVTVYEADTEKLNKEQQEEFAYFLQPNGAGNQELFAELFAAAYTPDANTDPHFEGLVRAFPKTTQLILKLNPKRAKWTAKAQAKPTPAKPETTTETHAAQATDRGVQWEPTATLYKRITDLYKQQRFYQVEPLMKQYIAQLERSNVPPTMLRQHYASYAALLHTLHRDKEAKAIELKSARTVAKPSVPTVENANGGPSRPIPETSGVIGIKFVTTQGKQPSVANVFPGTPAAIAKIQRNDEIVAINGESVLIGESKESIYDRIIGEPGSSIRITVRRGTQEMTFNLKRISISDIQDPVIRRDYINGR